MLTEISLNVIDIAQNSVRAGATLVEIEISRDSAAQTLCLRISDNGCGMTEDQLKNVTDPFFTSRDTRSVGLGVPFLKQEAECTGGSFEIHSTLGQGTVVEATFVESHIDCMPLGDINASIFTLIIGGEEVDYRYTYAVDERSFTIDTREIKEIMQGIPLQDPQVSAFIKSFLDENKQEVDG